MILCLKSASDADIGIGLAMEDPSLLCSLDRSQGEDGSNALILSGSKKKKGKKISAKVRSLHSLRICYVLFTGSTTPSQFVHHIKDKLNRDYLFLIT